MVCCNNKIRPSIHSEINEIYTMEISSRYILCQYRHTFVCLLLFVITPFSLVYHHAARAFFNSDSQEVAIAYRLDSEPVQFINQTGKPDGILIDIWKLWSKKAGVPVKFVGAYNKEAQQMVKDGRADINAGLFESEKRTEFLDFSNSIFSSSYYIFFRAEVADLKTEKDLKGHRVGVTAGSYHEQYLRTHFPEVEPILFKGYEDMFSAAVDGSLQVFISQPHYLTQYLKKRGMDVPFAMQSDPLYVRPYKAAVKKGNLALLQLINKYLDQITIEEYAAITRKWLGQKPGDGSSPKVVIDLTPEERMWLENNPVVDIGIDGNWPPIDFMTSTNQHSGIAAEYLDLIAKKLGITFRVHTGPTFKQMLKYVRSGKLPAAISIVKTGDRAEDLYFTQPFLTVHKAIVTRRDATGLDNIKALYGKKVAIENGFSTMRQLQQDHPEIELVPFTSTSGALKAVSWKKAEAYIGNRLVAQWILQQEQITNLHFSGDPGIGPADQRIAIHKTAELKPLFTALNKALADIDDQLRQSILNKWVSIGEEGFKTRKDIGLTDAEIAWLEAHKVIRIGIDNDWAPIEFADRSGRHQGISAEYMKYISELLEIKMVPEAGMGWSETLQAAKDKQVDLIPALVETENRKQYLKFSKSYITFPFVIFVPEREQFATGLEDFYGKKITVVRGYATHEYLSRDYPEIELVLVKSVQEGLTKVSLGEVDGYVGNLTVGSYIINNKGLTNVKVGAPTKYQYTLSIGVRKDWPELIPILNKVIDSLTIQEAAEIKKKWLSIRYDVGVDYSLLWKVIGIAFVVVLLVIIWLVHAKRQQGLLKRSEEQLKLIINTVPLSIVISDPDGTIVMANSYVMTDIESEGKPIIGHNLAEFYAHEEQRNKVIDMLKEQGRVDNFPVSFKTLKGNIIEGELSAIAIRIDDAWKNLGILVNLTDRIRMERQLSDATHAAEKANRFKSKFLANMSHEIRTPMNAIIGMSHLALNTELSEKQYDYVSKIKLSAHNLLGIINDILDFSKIEAGKLEIENTEFQINSVLDNLSSLIGIKAEEKDLELVFKQDINIPKELTGDPLRIGQVLLNLTQNAIKFTDKGEVVIAVRLVRIQAGRALINFKISDTGIGFNKDKKNQLFDAFVQADSSISRQHGGTGLGLSICNNLVALMGGHLRVESREGHGSIFEFELDLPVPDESGEASSLSIDNNQGIHVLVIDDNITAQQAIAEMLSSFSYRVSVADSVQQAYQILEKASDAHSPETIPVDLILLDGSLPDTNGVAVAKHIRTRLVLVKQPKILLTAAYGHEEIQDQVEEPGLDGYLTKPIGPSALFDAINTVIHKQKKRHHHRTEKQRRFKGKVLLVEDNSINQQVAKELLENLGLLVFIASNGEEAIKRVQQTDYDIVFMDIQMPGIDGFEVTRYIRNNLQNTYIPIIAMTAHALAGDRERCLAAGMDDYLSKPIDPDRLSRMIMAWMPIDETPLPVNDKKMTLGIMTPASVEGINVAWGLQRVGGNQKLFVRLLSNFYDNYYDCCETVRIQVETREAPALRRLLHTIEGITGNIGARDFYDVTCQLHKTARDDSAWDIPAALVDDFCTQAGIVFESIRQLILKMKKTNQGGDEATISNSLSQSEMKMLLNRLVLLVSDGDLEARVVFRQLATALRAVNTEVADLSLHLKQHLDHYNFEQALVILEKITGLMEGHLDG